MTNQFCSLNNYELDTENKEEAIMLEKSIYPFFLLEKRDFENGNLEQSGLSKCKDVAGTHGIQIVKGSAQEPHMSGIIWARNRAALYEANSPEKSELPTLYNEYFTPKYSLNPVFSDKLQQMKAETKKPVFMSVDNRTRWEIFSSSETIPNYDNRTLWEIVGCSVADDILTVDLERLF